MATGDRRLAARHFFGRHHHRCRRGKSYPRSPPPSTVDVFERWLNYVATTNYFGCQLSQIEVQNNFMDINALRNDEHVTLVLSYVLSEPRLMQSVGMARNGFEQVRIGKF